LRAIAAEVFRLLMLAAKKIDGHWQGDGCHTDRLKNA
jgi:hypothetical protein